MRLNAGPIDGPRRCFTDDGTKDGQLERAASWSVASQPNGSTIENRKQARKVTGKPRRSVIACVTRRVLLRNSEIPALAPSADEVSAPNWASAKFLREINEISGGSFTFTERGVDESVRSEDSPFCTLVKSKLVARVIESRYLTRSRDGGRVK